VRHKWENIKTVTVTVSWVLNGTIRDVLGWPVVIQIAGNAVKMLGVLNSFRRPSFSTKRNSVPWQVLILSNSYIAFSVGLRQRLRVSAYFGADS